MMIVVVVVIHRVGGNALHNIITLCGNEVI